MLFKVVDKVYLYKDKTIIKFKIDNTLYKTYGSVKDQLGRTSCSFTLPNYFDFTNIKLFLIIKKFGVQ